MESIRSKDGTRITFARSGAGPPLVLVHGTLSAYSRWTPILPVLEERFTVYAVDRRGRGASGDADTYALEREFEDIAAVVDATGEAAHLLGHSHGGLCALEAALLTPHVRSLIVYEPASPELPAPADILARLQVLLDAGDRAGAVTTFLEEIVRMPAHELALFQASPVFPARVAAAHTIPRELRAVTAYRFQPERFRNLHVPVLLLLGGDSPAFFKDAVEAWHTALPNSQIVVLPGQQHIAMDTAPELFVHEITRFLSTT